MHPYTLWPLQVTLFTPMAVKLWGDVCELMGSEHPLPPGFRESVVLEGVDGKAASMIFFLLQYVGRCSYKDKLTTRSYWTYMIGQ